ncbi:hypothetical protein N9M10_02700 [Hellea sp.]|nr:hypothetical protein [Hellea sp.]
MSKKKRNQYALISRPEWPDVQKIWLTQKRDDVRDIGSSPECWLTLPDPTLPPVVARLEHHGNHVYLYEIPKEDYPQASEIVIDDFSATRVDNFEFIVAGYKLVEIGIDPTGANDSSGSTSKTLSWFQKLSRGFGS